MKTSHTHSNRPLAWQRLKAKHKYLRRAALRAHIKYCRLSEILNGWIAPTEDEARRLGLTAPELRELAELQSVTTRTK